MRKRAARPRPKSILDAELILQRPRVRHAAKVYAEAVRTGGATPPLWGFDDGELEAIVRFATREPFDEKSFVKAWARHRPIAAFPRIDDPVGDLGLALAQPEILELWSTIKPRTGTRGPRPSLDGKALLFTSATAGGSAHFDNDWERLRTDDRLRSVFAAVERAAAKAAGTIPHALSSVPSKGSYAQALRELHKVADQFSPDAALDTNLHLVRAIHALHAPRKVRLAIDGMLAPAWIKQVGKRDPQQELRIRGVATNAGARFHEHRRRQGKEHGASRFVRGYDLITLVDLATGLPLTWTLWGADRDEAKALKLLLFELYERWPDLDADVVVADAAWDENWAAEWCLAYYGLHLVAQRKPSAINHLTTLTRFESEAVSKIQGDGTAICRSHNVPMVRDGYDGGSREGLPPGERMTKTIRLRYHCPVDRACGRVGLPMHLGWTSLAYHPHRMTVGRSELHAERLVLQARRSAHSEALHSALQVAHNLGLDGANRTRTKKEPTLDALFSIALVMRSATMLAEQRIERGLFPAEPWSERELRIVA